MTQLNARFACDCGQVQGEVAPATPALSNHALCYCDDCQAFMHFLGRGDQLDAKGGSDLVQVPPATYKITQGHDQIAGVRLTPKGLHRFYARCCNSPVGYAVSAAVPFVGMPVSRFRAAGEDPVATFGPLRAAIKGQFAIGGAPAGSKGVALGFMLSAIARVLGWKLTGRTWPHPFFERGGKTLYPQTILSPEQRERLRPLCGPRPA